MDSKLSAQDIYIYCQKEYGIQLEVVEVAKDIARAYQNQSEAFLKKRDPILVSICSMMIAHKISVFSNGPGQAQLRQFPLRNFLKVPGGSHRVDQVISELRYLIEYSPLDNIHILNELKHFVNNFTFSLLFFNKLDELWEIPSLEFEEKNRNFVAKLKEFTWLLFIIARVHLLQRQNDLIESACLLIGTIDIFLLNHPSEMTSKYDREFPVESESHTKSETIIWELCGSIGLTNSRPARISAIAVFKMIKRLIEAGIINHSNGNLSSIFNEDLIEGNFTKVYEWYQSKLTPEEIDEMVFRDIQARGGAEKNLKAIWENSTDTEMVEDFEPEEHKLNSLSLNSTLAELCETLPSPTFTRKSTAVPHTPMSAALEITNWFGQVKKFDVSIVKKFISDAGVVLKDVESFLSRELDKLAGLIQGDSSDVNQMAHRVALFSNTNEETNDLTENISSNQHNLVETIKSEITTIFYKLLEGMLMDSSSPKASDQELATLLTKPQFLLSIVAFSAQVVIYVFNYKHIRFDAFLQTISLSPFDFWRSMDAFFEIKEIPRQFITYFRELERQILSEMVWKQGSEIPELIEQRMSASSTKSDSSIFEELSQMESVRYRKFFIKTVQRATYLISSLGQNLNLPAYIQERIWDMIRVILRDQIYLLVNRILDQVLLCTIYAVCKISSDTSKLTFNHIISKYVDWYKAETLMSFVYSDTHFEKMFEKIYMDDLNDGDIMAFYNRKYVPTMKAYLIQLNSSAKPVKQATRDLNSRLSGMMINGPGTETSENPGIGSSETILKHKTLPYQVKSQQP